ncbi:MAG: phosphotransacetylase [Lachnospiraceae bacterium]|jgi:phosphate acetyltransferase|nr:phosphotransacetylase [Lachnospiraceae bacterium]
MFEFHTLINVLREDPKSIVFPEGLDPRVIEASSRLLGGNFLRPILVGAESEVQKAAQEAGYNIEGAKIIDPSTYEKKDEMIERFCEIRADKGMTKDKAEKILLDPNYFGTMLVKMEEYDTLLSGTMRPLIEIIKPALEIIKPKPGNKLVSSCMVLMRPYATGGSEILLLADCALNIDPTVEELVEIAYETANCAKLFEVDPKVAFLGYSTKGSAKGPDVDKMRRAAERMKEIHPEISCEGEVQFDAAVSPKIAKRKGVESEVAGHMNTFIFPNLTAANISYKMSKYLGHFDVFGPIFLGLDAPINALTRECTPAMIYSMAILTAATAAKRKK